MHKTNLEIDQELALILHQQPSRLTLDRYQFNQLPHALATEILAQWLRSHDIRDFDSKTLERLVVACKTMQHGKIVDINSHHKLLIGKDDLALIK